MNTETRGIGDNRPPNPLSVYLDDLSEAVKGPLAKLNELRLQQAGRIPEKFTSVDQCKKGITLACMLKDLIDTIELLMKNNRKPLDDMTKLMKTNGDAWLWLAQDFHQQVRGKVDAFMDMLPPDEKIRTDYGELAYRKEIFKFEVTDPDGVPRQLQTPDDGYIKEWIKVKTKGVENPEAIETILNEMHITAPGIRIYRDPQLVLTQGDKT